VKVSVRLFAVHHTNDLVGNARGKLSLDLERNCNRRVYQTREMRNYFVGNPTGVAPDARCTVPWKRLCGSFRWRGFLARSNIRLAGRGTLSRGTPGQSIIGP
jgi:hypothetical protein